MGKRKPPLTVSKEEIKDKLKNDLRWMERALVVLHDLQTNEEQNVGTTIVDNGKGFNGMDGRYLSYLAKWVKKGNHLSEKHMKKAGEKLPKYWKQISNMIEAEK